MRRMVRRWGRLAAAVTTVLGGLALAGAPGAKAAVATSRFVAVTPSRILDTRDGTGAAGPVATGGTITLALAGRAGIGAAATAVVLNVTATDTTAAGFVTVWPSGTTRPVASNLNVERRGQTIANLVVVPLGADGAVQLFAQTSMHLVADVAGWFEPTASASGGRLVPAITPTRLVDTRNGTGNAFGRVAAGAAVRVDVAGAVGAGYRAAVVNITATEATAGGYVTAWPSGTGMPIVSNLNLETVGQTIANLAIVPLGTDGAVSVFTQNGTHLVVDLVAVITDDSAPSNGDGLFVPRSPTRVLDTRDGTGAPAAPVGAGGAVNVTVAGGGTALLNVTATNTRAGGYFTMWPAGRDMPVASSLNATRANQTIANLAISATGASSAASIFSQNGADLVADLAGTFTAAPAITPVPPAVAQNPPPPVSGRDRFHAIYAIPSDASLAAGGGQPDLTPAALVPAIRSEIGRVRDWFASQSGNRKPLFVLGADSIEVTVMNLPITIAALEVLGNSELDKVVELVTAAGALKPYEMGVIYLAALGPACGETLDDSVLYLKQCGGIYPRTDQLFPFGATYLAAHEMTHAFGAVDACAPHDDGTGHVTDSPADVLYQGGLDRDWNHLQLDVGHDDYYGHSIPGCQDISTHAAWLPAGAA